MRCVSISLKFTGQRQLAERMKSVADCYHGDVVRALRDAFDGTSEVLKNREIDLVVVTNTRALLFEVKTSAKTQSVYTAIGQLTAHSPGVAKILKRGIPLVRAMVLADRPTERLANLLTEELDIRLVTFTRSAQGRITIEGLDSIK